MQIQFVILSPNGKQKTVQTRLPILVGRAEEARFRIPKDSVSRRHCEFFWKEDSVFVRDLGSTNGTRLDDMQLQGGVAMRVSPGATVRIAGITMRVEYEAAPHQQPGKAATVGDETVPIGAQANPAARTIEVLPAEIAAAVEAQVAEAEAAEAVEAEAAEAVEAEAAEAVEAEAAEAEAAEPAIAEASPEPAAGWPVASAEPAAPDDESLNNFFKSLK